MQINNIYHPMDPPHGAVDTGERHNGRAVYRMAVEVPGRLVPLKDESGALLFNQDAKGMRTTQRTMREPSRFEEREFVLEPVGNGVVTANYSFRPDPEDVARLEAQKASAPEVLLARMEAMEAERVEREAKWRAEMEELRARADASDARLDAAAIIIRDAVGVDGEEAKELLEAQEAAQANLNRHRQQQGNRPRGGG